MINGVKKYLAPFLFLDFLTYICKKKLKMTATEVYVYFFNHCSIDSRGYLYKSMRRMKKRRITESFPWMYPDFSDTDWVDRFLGRYDDSLYYLMSYFPVIKEESMREGKDSVIRERTIKEWRTFLRKKVRKNIYRTFGIFCENDLIFASKYHKLDFVIE